MNINSSLEGSRKWHKLISYLLMIIVSVYSVRDLHLIWQTNVIIAPVLAHLSHFN